MQKVSQTRCRSRRQLLQPVIEDNEVGGEITGGSPHNCQNRELCSCTFASYYCTVSFDTMKKGTKQCLICFVLLLCAGVVIAILILASVFPKSDDFPCVVLNGKKTCHSTNANPYRFYGTKTAYSTSTPAVKKKAFEIQGCKPILFYLLCRHATRYPDREDIELMLQRLPLLKQLIVNASHSGKVAICQEDLNDFESWSPKLNPDDDNKLSTSGETEAIELAQRYKARFPSILEKPYSPEDFVFAYTSRERTRSTGEKFAEGLFGKDATQIDFDGKENDDVLQFHKTCKKLQQNCSDTEANLDELTKYEKGPLPKAVARSISRRLGFDVTEVDVEVMYRACSFGYALERNSSWCSVFSTDELKVLEYGGDMDDYYKDGFGNKINYEQACPVARFLVDLFEYTMNETKADSTHSKAVLHFTHAGAVKKVFPLLGLFHDSQPLSAEGLCTSTDRKWKSSLISPFNSNIALVLFKCDQQYKLAGFVNEQQVIIGGCNEVMCPVEEFFTEYEPVAINCLDSWNDALIWHYIVAVLTSIFAIAIVFLLFTKRKYDELSSQKPKNEVMENYEDTTSTNQFTENAECEVAREYDKESDEDDIKKNTKKSTAQIAEMVIKANMTDEQRVKEQEIRRQQLAEIFSLMQQQADKFGEISLSEVEEQMKLYQ